MTPQWDWNNIENGDIPKSGQRCLVWDEEWQQARFATWERRQFFYRVDVGRISKIKAVLWMPEPDVGNGDGPGD